MINITKNLSLPKCASRYCLSMLQGNGSVIEKMATQNRTLNSFLKSSSIETANKLSCLY